MSILGDIVMIISLCLVGLVAGSESATLIIHQTVDRLPFTVGRQPAQAINERVGSLMPVLMPMTVIATLAAALLTLGTASSLLFFFAVGALVIMLLITFLGLAPLNALEDGADDRTPEGDWRGWRNAWMRLHGLRVLFDLVALVLAAAAAVIH